MQYLEIYGPKLSTFPEDLLLFELLLTTNFSIRSIQESSDLLITKCVVAWSDG